MNEKYRIIMLGPQGSGKGTQADMLAAKLNIPKISTGDIFRQNIKEETELGQQVKAIIDAGKLVPDELTNDLMKNRIQEPDCSNGFILDGYPRNLFQAEALDKVTQITHVLEVYIPDEESVKRIGGRRSCPCGKVYHLEYNPPKNDETCNDCGEKLYIRDDDKPEAIQERLKIYHEQSEPLVEYYSKKGVHVKIDGLPAIAEVSGEILDKLNVQ